jgi:hypothetical protein
MCPQTRLKRGLDINGEALTYPSCPDTCHVENKSPYFTSCVPTIVVLLLPLFFVFDLGGC